MELRVRTALSGGLPYVDEHAIRIAASREQVWNALQHYAATSLRLSDASPVARLLGTEPRAGFEVSESHPTERMTLVGRHRFSRYLLTFELTDAEGATQLRASTYAAFPGVRGEVYRTFVIRSRLHAVATNRILRSVRRVSLEPTSASPRFEAPGDDGGMTWTAPEMSLPDGPLTGEARPILEGYLAWHRALLRLKCAGLTGDQLAQCSVPPSNLSLLGLVRHMAKVERTWFRERIAGQELEPMYDPALGKDADFEDLDPARAPSDYERFLEECRLADEALAAAAYDDTITVRGDTMSVLTVVVHMIEEYAQHNGHADLLRERIDGATET